MRGGSENCFEVVREIWAAWPDAAAVDRRSAEHAQGCPVCGPELRSFSALCARGTGAGGRPLGWAGILSPERLGRLAEATRGALDRRPRPRRAWLWVPALAAAAFILLLRLRPRRHEAPPAGAVEALDDMELLDRMGLLENLDDVEKLLRRAGPR